MQVHYTPPFTKLWAISLHSTLTERVKGNVYVDIQTDTLIVTIHNKLGIAFKYHLPNIDREIVLGLDAKMVTEEIVKQYKRFINNQFFVK